MTWILSQAERGEEEEDRAGIQSWRSSCGETGQPVFLLHKIEEHNTALSIFIICPARKIGLHGIRYVLKSMKKIFSVGLAPSAYASLPSVLSKRRNSRTDTQGSSWGKVSTQTFIAGTVIQGFLLEGVGEGKKQFEEKASNRLYMLLHPKAVVMKCLLTHHEKSECLHPE